MDLALVVELLPEFGRAALRSLALVACAGVGGVVLGFAFNAWRISGGVITRRAFALYVIAWRGTPFLAQLFVVYFGLPAAGIALTPFEAATATLTFYGAAYFAEIFRACWEAIPSGQLEAAAAIGLTRPMTFVYIEMPQALRLSVPLLGNQAVLLLKESALASVITYPELTMTTGRVVAERFAYVEPYVLLAAAYWSMTLMITAIARHVQRKVALPFDRSDGRRGRRQRFPRAARVSPDGSPEAPRRVGTNRSSDSLGAAGPGRGDAPGTATNAGPGTIAGVARGVFSLPGQRARR